MNYLRQGRKIQKNKKKELKTEKKKKKKGKDNKYAWKNK